MITTAGNGPGPSGLLIVTGISSRAPLGAVVTIERSETIRDGGGLRDRTGGAAGEQPRQDPDDQPAARLGHGSAILSYPGLQTRGPLG